MSLYACSVCSLYMSKPAEEWLCPCDCCAGVKTTRGCEEKPIKKCHQAPLLLSQRLLLRKKTLQQRKKKMPSLHRPASSFFPPPHTKIWYLQTLLQFTIKKFPCPWRTQQTSLFSCTEEGWKQWARVPGWLLTSSENDLVFSPFSFCL